jgi:hypothetical protein
MKKLLIIVISMLLSVILTGCNNSSEWEDYLYFDNELTLADHLYVLSRDKVSTYEDLVLAQAIQGIVAKRESKIYIEAATKESAYEEYLQLLVDDYGITYEYVDDVYSLIDIFKDEVNGYSLYHKNLDSINVAFTYAGLTNTLPITSDQVEAIENLGINFEIDLTSKDYSWLIDNYKDDINWDYVIQQSPNWKGIRDYGIANQGLYMNYHYLALSANDLNRMGYDSPMLGWGSTDEVSDVADLSYYGITTVATNHSYNLSLFGAEQLRIDSFKQKFDRSSIETEDKHYVAFVMSDGDNIQWMMNGYLQDERWFGASERGQIPFGWSIGPTAYDLVPTVLNQYYEQATTNDYLLAGVSGSGYFYPDKMPEEALNLHLARTNEYFERLDLDYTVIMGTRAFDTDKSTLEKYANVANLKGGFIYANFDRYMGYRGEIWWENDKPFLSARNALWEIENLQEFADMINSYEVDPYSINGYTLITVHCWSHSFNDVIQVVNAFDDDIEVVSPYHLMELINENIPHQNAKPQ